MPIQLQVTNNATDPLTAHIAVTGAPASGLKHVQCFRSDPSTRMPLDLNSVDFAGTGFSGTLNLTYPGLYFFFCWDVNTAAFSELVPCLIDDGSDPIQAQTRACIKARIESLNLGMSGGVVEQWTPDKLNLKFPCVLLTHEGTIETNTQRVAGTSDVGRPVRIMICDHVNQRNQAKMKTYDAWRQAIWRGLDNQRLPGLRVGMKVEIEPDVISNPQTPKYQFMVSELVARVTCREPAYNGA